MCIFKVHNVSQLPNLRHLAELLGGAVGLLEAVSFKEVTESVCRGRTTDARAYLVPKDISYKKTLVIKETKQPTIIIYKSLQRKCDRDGLRYIERDER